MKIEVKHVVFNPLALTGGSSVLASITAALEGDGWQLTRIIPHLQFESVAVFERLVPVDEKPVEEEAGEGGYV